jgi:hypothetical protein
MCTQALAAELSAGQQKLLAKRAAQVDAYRNLAETIKGFRIDSTTSVKDFVCESDVINTAFRTFIKGAKPVGDPRYYEDGTCEVDVQITLVEVITTLKRIVKRHYRGKRYTDEVISKISTHVTSKTITATGAGAPRMAKTEEASNNFISPPPKARVKLSVPAIWRKYKPNQRFMAKRAATLDAYRNLAENIKGFRIDAKTSVKDFVTESDEINTALTTFLKGVRIIDVRYGTDEPIVEVDVEITLVEVVEYLKTIVKRHYHGRRYTDEVINRIRTETTRKIIRATGFGTIGGKPVTEPPPFTPPVVEPEPVAPSQPAWATKTVRAVGNGAPPDDADSEAKARLMAKRAAKLDAYRNLFERVAGVQIDAKTTVKDFITESDEIKARARGYIQGARVIREEEAEDGTWEVEVEITLMDIYKLYRKYHP